MNEADIVGHLLSFTEIFVAAIALTFTIVSAYIAALYYFIKNADLLFKVVAFVFFTGILAQLGVLLYGSTVLFNLLRLSGEMLVEKKEGSMLMEKYINAASSFPILVGSIFPWLLGISVYFALFYLTFIRKWDK